MIQKFRGTYIHTHFSSYCGLCQAENIYPMVLKFDFEDNSILHWHYVIKRIFTSIDLIIYLFRQAAFTMCLSCL